MDNNDTWIKLQRKIIDWEWFTDPRTLQLWLYLLLSANVEDRRVRGTIVKRGQIMTSRYKLAEYLECDYGTISKTLKKLENEDCIKILYKNGDKHIIITICKYEQYQGNHTKNSCSEPCGESCGEPCGKPRATKECKNISLVTSNSNIYKATDKSVAMSECDSDAAESDEERIDYAKLIEYWNTKTQGKYGLLRSIENNRRKSVTARVRTNGKKALFDAINMAAESTYLSGANWFNFDWLIRPNNFDKVLAGNYTDRKGTAEQHSDTRLGVGEYITETGKRTYANGKADVPMDAPPRPGKEYFWFADEHRWAT